MPVGKLAERRRLAALEAADAMGHRLRPVKAALGVECDAIGIHVWQLEQHLATAVPVDDEQPPGRANVEAVVSLRTGVGEVEPAVRPEGEVVRAVQLVAGHLRAEELDLPVARDALDPGYRARIAAAGDVAALGDVYGAVVAHNRAQRQPPHRRKVPTFPPSDPRKLPSLASANPYPPACLAPG